MYGDLVTYMSLVIQQGLQKIQIKDLGAIKSGHIRLILDSRSYVIERR